MNTEKQSQKARKLDLNKPFIILIAEEICQHSKQLCQEAAEARERAQEIMGYPLKAGQLGVGHVR
jgi:hypothetical protein